MDETSENRLHNKQPIANPVESSALARPVSVRPQSKIPQLPDVMPTSTVLIQKHTSRIYALQIWHLRGPLEELTYEPPSKTPSACILVYHV